MPVSFKKSERATEGDEAAAILAGEAVTSVLLTRKGLGEGMPEGCMEYEAARLESIGRRGVAITDNEPCRDEA